MEKILIGKKDLKGILEEYDQDEYEATPLNVLSFVDHIFIKYQPEQRQNYVNEKCK